MAQMSDTFKARYLDSQREQDGLFPEEREYLKATGNFGTTYWQVLEAELRDAADRKAKA